MVDRWLRGQHHESFFSFDIFASSGLRDLMAEIKTSTESTSASTAAKTLSVLNALNQQLNTERFLDAQLEVGAPLPYFSIKQYAFLPSIFYELNLGVSLSISNFGDATNPRAQVYIKKDQKTGLKTSIRRNEIEQLDVAIYRLNRADSSTIITASQIAQNAELFDLNSLDESHQMLSSDLNYSRQLKNDAGRPDHYFIGAQELQLWSLSATRKSYYGTSPLLNGGVGTTFKGRSHQWDVKVGMHWRKRYDLLEGFYSAAKVSWPDRSPFEVLFRVDPGFLSLMPQIQTKYLQFSYAYKTPFRNPQQTLWTPAMHVILLNIHFPI
jgi:hypothetical protein